MTAPNYNEWEVKSLQARYNAMLGITLDIEQAEKVFLFEKEKNSGSSKYFFSAWEELDYEQVIFQEILTPLQFEHYKSEKKLQLKQIEESLSENDKQYLPQLNAAQERLVYYKEILIPALHKNLRLCNPTQFYYIEKVNFLKSEYRKYLTDAKKQILVEHFRHYKTFQPILLKLSLLEHEQICLYPDYFAFKATMDTPTRAVADYLLEKLSRVADSLSEKLKETMAGLKEFNTHNTAKHLCEIRGWHTMPPVNDKTEELMFTILFDPEKYI